jgi:hypothetical protein
MGEEGAEGLPVHDRGALADEGQVGAATSGKVVKTEQGSGKQPCTARPRLFYTDAVPLARLGDGDMLTGAVIG